MNTRIITIKLVATLDGKLDFKEYQFPELTKLLESGWNIRKVHQATTNENVGFLFLTFELEKY
jgi:hypothetical protein